MRRAIVAVVLFVELLGTVDGGVRSEKVCGRANKLEPLEEVIDSIVEEISRRSECIVFVIDAHYRRIVNFHWAHRSRFLVPIYAMAIRESEDFFPPRDRVASIVKQSKDAGCDAYVILIANPLQVSQFLRYTEKERLIDTRGSFLLMHDRRLFEGSWKYLWNRITNVVFVRRLSAGSTKRRSGERVSREWFNLETVYYPARVKTFVLTRYLDTWYRGKFRYGGNHFVPKIRDLRRRSLRVAVMEHIPAVTRQAVKTFQRFAEDSNRINERDTALGIEFELIKIIAKRMNFEPEFYAPYGIETSRWGRPGENESFEGLLGESLSGKAAFLIGDLYYTLRHNRLIDLSLPYNTECLTFLTPEALNDNSWKLLIVPFELYTWIAVILTLILGACIFHLFALTYHKYISLHRRKKDEATSMRRKPSAKEPPQSLQLFIEPGNSIMYTYSMLLQVSLPRIPSAWAVRVFIGWWWLYSILVTVAYRASMTATLANPISRVTIDTIAELVKSRIAVGGWTDEQRDLFLLSSDEDVRKIGEKFELTSNEEEAIARVANGSFCYYENVYVLKQARALRQQFEYHRRRNATSVKEVLKVDRDLHIMQECFIDMPISIGMDKNSPLKPQVDHTIRRVVEAGFVAKWLSDVMEWTKIVELRFRLPPEQTLVNLHKLHGALVALGIGYFCSFVALAGEKLHWKYIIQRDPSYDKYQMDVFYAKAQKAK